MRDEHTTDLKVYSHVVDCACQLGSVNYLGTYKSKNTSLAEFDTHLYHLMGLEFQPRMSITFASMAVQVVTSGQLGA